MEFPFLTTYDPPGTSEGTLDPLGLYQIADQLAVQLVPAVRERMIRIRFLTAMAVGTFITEGFDDNPQLRDASPYLVWEWLIVESFVRSMPDDPAVRGVPGILVSRRAIQEYGYLDARSYLKTPRIFGFHGVYKRLAVHLGVVDVHLGRGPNAAGLVNAWARDLGLEGIDGTKPVFARWREALRRSLAEKSARTKPAWTNQAWDELAQSLAPANARAREKRYLRELLLAADARPLGALPLIWKLQSEFHGDGYYEEALHDRLEHIAPAYGPLIRAIRAYEAFARSLQDAFDVLKATAAGPDARGYVVADIAQNADFVASVSGLCDRFDSARQSLGDVGTSGLLMQNIFDERFAAFGQPLDAGECAIALCQHHETVQQRKSADGKRPWFDRIGPQRIYVRHAFREAPRDIKPGRYVHAYRSWPIRRFYNDLS